MRTGARLGGFVAASMLVFVVLAGATSVSRAPSRDEAWFANPAVSWVVHGHTGSTVLQEDSWLPNLPVPVNLTRIRERTYWIMPGHTVAQRVWYEWTGVGLFEMRALSVAVGAIGLLSVFVYARRLFGSAAIAALSVGLLAVDFRYVTMAGNGRMDILAAVFGLVAYAWYVRMRDRSLSLALAGSVLAVGAGVFTHPVAIASGGGLVVLAARLDGRRLRAVHVACGLAAALVSAAAFGVYATQDIEAFRDQLSSNAAGRFDDLVHPWNGVVMILSLLFATSAFGGTVGLVGVLIPVLLAAGVAGARFGGSQPYREATRTVLWQLGATVLYLMFFENQKLHFYLVHVTPLAMILTGTFIVSVFEGGHRFRQWVVAGAVAVLVLVQLAPTAVRLLRQEYSRAYTPAVQAAAAAAGRDRRVLGSPEMAFAFGFDRVTDDRRLRLARQAPAAVIVISEEDKIFWPWLPDDEERAIADELASRALVFQNHAYSVYGPR